MALPDIARVYRNEGRLVVDATDFSAAFPHGGTALGATAKIRLDHGISAEFIHGEEYGGQPIDAIAKQDAVILTALIRSWDEDAVELLFQGAAGGISGERAVSWPGSNRCGRLLYQDARRITFVARDKTMPSVHLFKAIPILDPEKELSLGIIQTMDFLATFVGLRSGTGQIGQMGLLEDLTEIL